MVLFVPQGDSHHGPLHGEIPLYVGGNLVIGKTSFGEVEAKFKKMGFNRVYPPGTLPEIAIGDLIGDLANG